MLSLMTPIAPPPSVSTQPPAADPAAPQTGANDVDVVGRDADLVEAAPTAPGAPSGQSDDLAPLEDADTQPGPLPEVGGATGDLENPTAPTAPDVAVTGDTPAPAPGAVSAPTAPGSETELSISTEPAQPAAPSVPEAGSGFGTEAPETEPAPDVTASTDTEPAQAEPDAVAGATPDAGPEAPENGAAPQIAALPQAGADATGEARPTIGTPVAPLTDRADTAAPTDQTPEAGAETGPPIEAHAAPFENADSKPLMAIVLIDDAGSIGAEALAGFPYPLTFAIDPTAADAADKMALRRASGFEVVAMVDLPAAATASDAEVALAASFAALPETVAIMEGTGTGIQGNRALSDQVTAIAQGTGRGLITQSSGLNTVQKLAAREGVPSAVVFRDFDGAGQTPTVMRRFLDQAAFRAGQEGAVIMLGRVQPDTISALLLWGLQDRAERVALAPVSAVLKGAVAGE